MLLIDRVDACHNCVDLGHVTKLCKIDSLYSLHIGHIGSMLIFLFIRLSLVDNALLHVFHMEYFIFVRMFS